jgi:hypothetical protein
MDVERFAVKFTDRLKEAITGFDVVNGRTYRRLGEEEIVEEHDVAYYKTQNLSIPLSTAVFASILNGGTTVKDLRDREMFKGDYILREMIPRNI